MSFSLLAALVALYWLAQLVQTILNLWLLPRLREAEMPEGDGRRVSIVIPARNEARHIEPTLRAALAQSWRNLEVVLVDDRSSDATGDIGERLAASDSRLRVVRGSEPPPGWLGKPWALQQGALAATGELLIFLDADVIYAPGTVAAAVEFLDRSGAAMVSLFPTFRMEGWWENVLMPQLAMVGLVHLPSFLGNRWNVPILAIGGGPGNLVRLEDYEAVGRHERLRNAVVDDVGLARLIRRDGRRALFVLALDFVSLRMYEGGGEIVRGFTKNTFAVLGESFLSAFGVVLMAFTLHLAPYFWGLAAAVRLASGAPPGPALRWGALSLLLLLATRVLLFRALRYRLSSAVLGYPPAILAGLVMLARSFWRSGVRGRTDWRGRTYSDTTPFGP